MKISVMCYPGVSLETLIHNVERNVHMNEQYAFRGDPNMQVIASYNTLLEFLKELKTRRDHEDCKVDTEAQ